VTPAAAEAVVDYCVDQDCASCHRLKTVSPTSDLINSLRPTVEGMCCPRCFRNGPKPLTIVPPQQAVTLDEMAGRVIATREKFGPILQEFHKVWYECGHTWPYTHFLGVGLMKCPFDLWIYQALMTEHRPQVVIETGTYQGGSALWFAMLMDMLSIDGHVYTIDIDDHRSCNHPRITFLAGDSRDPKVLEAIEEDIRTRGLAPLDGGVEKLSPDSYKTFTSGREARRLVCLDADHSAAHVYAEMNLYAPGCRVGDWLIVEDTNIGWGDEHGITVNVGANPLEACCSCSPDDVFIVHEAVERIRCPKDDGLGDAGARGGVEKYLREHEGEFRQDVLCERYLLSMNPGGWLQRVASHV
jgi:cephalosporin hydroxylase